MVGKRKKPQEQKPADIKVENIAIDADKVVAGLANLDLHGAREQSLSTPELTSSVAPNEPTDQEEKPLDKVDILAIRKARAEEAKARKVAAAEAKKVKKAQEAANKANETAEIGKEKIVRAEMAKSESGAKKSVPQVHIRKQKKELTCAYLRDPFKTVQFDLRIKESSEEEPVLSTENVHPAFLEFACKCEAGAVIGIDAICILFIYTFKEYLSDYRLPSKRSLSRDLDQAIRPQLSYLTENGKYPFPLALGNLIRQLKKEIHQLPDDISETKGKEHLSNWLDEFVTQNFELALEAISSFCIQKLQKKKVILTYGRCPIVERIILDAHKSGHHFEVCIVDSPIEKRGFCLAKTLNRVGIMCKYGLITSISYLINECEIVLLGCSAILSNGVVMAERGSGQIALVASISNIPVLVAAQTCKFVDRVQSFSHGLHEVSALLNERQEAIPADLITAVVTEFRILPPSSAPAVLKAKLGCD